jgi:hypothetical protein
VLWSNHCNTTISLITYLPTTEQIVKFIHCLRLLHINSSLFTNNNENIVENTNVVVKKISLLLITFLCTCVWRSLKNRGFQSVVHVPIIIGHIYLNVIQSLRKQKSLRWKMRYFGTRIKEFKTPVIKCIYLRLTIQIRKYQIIFIIYLPRMALHLGHLWVYVGSLGMHNGMRQQGQHLKQKHWTCHFHIFYKIVLGVVNQWSLAIVDTRSPVVML